MSTPSHDPFANARAQLDALQQELSKPSVDLIAMAKAYAAFARALLAAVEQAGQSSMRFQAVVKALDLTTPKSALRRFLDES